MLDLESCNDNPFHLRKPDNFNPQTYLENCIKVTIFQLMLISIYLKRFLSACSTYERKTFLLYFI